MIPNFLAWEQWTLTKLDGSPACMVSKLSCVHNQRVFITSHRQEQLQDAYGKVSVSPNRLDWEQWTINDAGNGKVFITSHRNENLQDAYGSVGMSPNRFEWERWMISDAGNGKVFITSHRSENLLDLHGKMKTTPNLLASEAWMITKLDGSLACTV